MMTIRILSSGLRDLEEGREFYERQAPGVGDYFLNCLLTDIDCLERYGGIHKVVFGFHRLLSKRFPYAIYYRMDEPSVAVVYRVLDCRQDPARTRRQLGSALTDLTRGDE